MARCVDRAEGKTGGKLELDMIPGPLVTQIPFQAEHKNWNEQPGDQSNLRQNGIAERFDSPVAREGDHPTGY